MERYLKLAQGKMTASSDAMYRVPMGYSTILRHIRLVNSTGVNRTVTLYQGGLGSANVILPPTVLVTGGWGEFDGTIILGEGEVLYGDADLTNAITYTLYGLEVEA